MVRAVRRIQKIIQVTKPTAMIDSEPPSASWASNVSACWVSASARVTPTLIATAIPTPSHTLGSTWRRSVRTRNATRMLDDQRGFEALTQADQEVAQHGCLLRPALLVRWAG